MRYWPISNVPVPGEWYLYARMQSLAGRGAGAAVECATRRDGEVVDIGELQVQPGYRLRGCVVLRDGKAVGDGMRMTLARDAIPGDDQTVLVGTDGRFEFAGVPAERVSLAPSVKGYALSLGRSSTGILMAGDVNDFVVTLSPASETGSELAALRARLLEGPVLVLALDQQARFRFNSSLMPVEERGFIFVSGVVTAGWGTLRAEEGGLLSSDFKTITVSAPADGSPRSVRGPGWELELKPGWSLEAATRKGNWLVRQEN